MLGKILDAIKLGYEKRAMDYQISKDKYEKTDMLLKNFKNMTTAEISNHLTFILGYPVDSKLIEKFFNIYKDPILAIKLYKKCHFIIDKKENKKSKKYRLGLGDKILNFLMSIVAIILFSYGLGLIFIQPFLIDLFQNVYTNTLISFTFGGILFWSIIDTLVKNDLANKFENLEKMS